MILKVLLGILQRRGELDKEGLFQFTQIKRESKLVDNGEKNPIIAPVLMKFQRGCHQVRSCFYFMSVLYIVANLAKLSTVEPDVLSII